jgi:hypothetical protein
MSNTPPDLRDASSARATTARVSSDTRTAFFLPAAALMRDTSDVDVHVVIMASMRRNSANTASAPRAATSSSPDQMVTWMLVPIACCV